MPREKQSKPSESVRESPRRSARKRTHSESTVHTQTEQFLTTLPTPIKTKSGDQSTVAGNRSPTSPKVSHVKKNNSIRTSATDVSPVQNVVHRTKTATAEQASQAKRKSRVKQETESLEREQSPIPSDSSSNVQHKIVGRASAKPSKAEHADKALSKTNAKPGKTVVKVLEADGEKPIVVDETQALQQTPVKKKRKTKEEKEAEAMPLASRTPGLKMFVGAHTSIAKGVENAVHNCTHIGGNAFACFLKSQRKWDNPPLKDENRDAFRRVMLENKYDGKFHVVPHGSYLVNLATEDPGKAEQSYAAFLDDLRRCEALGIRYYNFHPGAAGQSAMADAIRRLAANLNRALDETDGVVPLLENMAGTGSIIGGRFSDLAEVISLIKPEHQSRIGVCLDTCHAFAAGYDLRSPIAFQQTLKEFDEIVGIKYLKALHINDSKAPFGSKRDLHQNIGLGFLGLRAFHNVMNEARFHNLPLILETPCERPDPQNPNKTVDDKNVWAREIKLLESLIDLDPKGSTFKDLEQQLSDEGRTEREKMQKTFDKKIAETEKKLAKEREKGQTSLRGIFGQSQTQQKPPSKSAKTSRRRSKSSSSLSSSEADT